MIRHPDQSNYMDPLQALGSIGDEGANCAPAITNEKRPAMRRRFKQELPFKDRLTAWATAVRDKAALLPPGSQRDELMKKISQADAAAEMERWMGSTELQPPR